MNTLIRPVQTETHLVENIYENVRTSKEVYASVAMVLAAFSKPPFSEEWKINGELIPGLLRVPEATQELLETLYQGENKIPENFSDKWSESWSLEKSTILKVLSKYTHSTANQEFIDENKESWITKEERKGIENFKSNIERDPSGKIVVSASYPPSKLLISYKEQSEDPRSLVLLGGYEAGSEKFITERVTPEISTSIDRPRVMGRIRHIDPKKEGLLEACREELTYYLTDERFQEAMELVKPDTEVQTIFLGEIAKVEGIAEIEGVTIALATKYFTDIVRGDVNNLPTQCIYFTLAGTKVAKHGLVSLANLAIQKTIDTPLRFKEEKTEVQWNDTTLIIGKLSLIEP